MQTRFLITVDTEFSIGGTFGQPAARKPVGPQNVLCNVAGVSQGLGFLLDTLGAHGLPATFFVETMQTSYFGDAPMGELARRIVDAGHDAQLHLHPVWSYFDHPDWQRRLAHVPPNDDCHGRTVADLVAWMRRGIDAFARWSLPAPVALRTGNLVVDRTVYRAMADAGLEIGSNVARALFDPEEPALRLNGGMHRIEGIMELPVLTYRGLGLGHRGELKSLTIAGSSTDETIHVLERAHRQRCPSVVLLTHCHEFVKGDMADGLRVNRLNQSRLIALCTFLSNDGRFRVSTMSEMAGVAPASGTEDPLLSVPTRLALRRIVENTLSDRNVT